MFGSLFGEGWGMEECDFRTRSRIPPHVPRASFFLLQSAKSQDPLGPVSSVSPLGCAPSRAASPSHQHVPRTPSPGHGHGQGAGHQQPSTLTPAPAPAHAPAHASLPLSSPVTVGGKGGSGRPRTATSSAHRGASRVSDARIQLSLHCARLMLLNAAQCCSVLLSAAQCWSM